MGKESYGDQISRLEMMAEDDGGTWDLSLNDRLAITAVLANLKEAYRLLIHTKAVPPGFATVEEWCDVRDAWLVCNKGEDTHA